MRYRHHRAVPFSLDICGWEVEICDLGITLLPLIRHPDDYIDASLQFFDDDAGREGVDSARLLERLRGRVREQARSPSTVRIAPVTCGEFAGWHCELDDRNREYWRLWELGRDRTELFVAYSIPSRLFADRRRHRKAVDQILSTLSAGDA